MEENKRGFFSAQSLKMTKKGLILQRQNQSELSLKKIQQSRNLKHFNLKENRTEDCHYISAK